MHKYRDNIDNVFLTVILSNDTLRFLSLLPMILNNMLPRIYALYFFGYRLMPRVSLPTYLSAVTFMAIWLTDVLSRTWRKTAITSSGSTTVHEGMWNLAWWWW